MTENESSTPSWQTPLVVTFGIVLVVLAALLLTQIDNIQRRSVLPPKRLPVIDQEATVVSGDLGVIYLPNEMIISAAATSIPIAVSPTPSEAQTATVVAVLIPSCNSTPKDWTDYIVQPGDSLSALAIQSGVSKKAIVQGNCLSHDQVIHGQVIYLPQNIPSAINEKRCGAPQGWIHYVVHPGDSLLKLAKDHESTVFLIMKANCLESTYLAAGRKLFLPPKAPPQDVPTRILPSPTRTRPKATPTATFISIFIPTSTSTSTSIFIPTPIESETPLPTTTIVPSPTNTGTPLPQTPTGTPSEPIETPWSTPTTTPTSTPTATNTPFQATSTTTSTPVSPSPTSTLQGYPPADSSPTATIAPYPS